MSSNCAICLAGSNEWVKATASNTTNACVELAPHGELIALRNSREPDTILHFTKDEIQAFVSGARGGEFDRLVG